MIAEEGWGVQRKKPKIPGHYLVTAFEATNDTRKEIFLGSTHRLLSSLIQEHAASPPKPIAHWERGDRIRYHSIDYSMEKRNVARFLSAYARTRRVEGWKILR